MTATEPGLVVLYRWRLKPGSEAQFIADWSAITARLRAERDSRGSRLHRGDDGFWYGYAQWPDAQTLERVFASPLDAEAAARMGEAILERFAPVHLDVVADYLVGAGQN